jgi:predicted GIY-YIG superfamily endonuclease
MRKGTTEIGYTNKNQQRVVRKTDEPGNDHLQRVYVLRCEVCQHEYGANGSDIWQRRCPQHDSGAPGLPVPGQS